MASMYQEGPKKWRIQFMDLSGNGERRQIRFTNTKKYANTLLNTLERLIEARGLNASIDQADATWLTGLPDKFYSKLARYGLVNPRTVQAPEPEPDVEPKLLLSAFLEDHTEHGRTAKGKEAAESTRAKWRSTKRFLIAQFPGRELESITAEDAHQFRVWLDNRRIKQKTAGRRGQPMEENAKRKHIANCKMFFNAAKRRGLIATNPFDAQISSVEANKSREHYIDPDVTGELLEVAPDAQWRLLIALWRLAGLRKMEVFNPTWRDVLWDQGKVRVRSTKTEHVEGYDIRYVPIRDIRPYLEDALRLATPQGQQGVPADAPIITRFSASNTNLDKPFRKIIEAAGMVPWPKLFQNMRSSCETQWLRDGERADLVANWIGHSVKVQRKFYIQHTDEDIDAFNQKSAFQHPFERSQKKATEKATEPAQTKANPDEPRDASSMKTLESNVLPTEDYPGWDSNPHAPIGTPDFKSGASANSATRAE
jgi:integrase